MPGCQLQRWEPALGWAGLAGQASNERPGRARRHLPAPRCARERRSGVPPFARGLGGRPEVWAPVRVFPPTFCLCRERAGVCPHSGRRGVGWIGGSKTAGQTPGSLLLGSLVNTSRATALDRSPKGCQGEAFGVPRPAGQHLCCCQPKGAGRRHGHVPSWACKVGPPWSALLRDPQVPDTHTLNRILLGAQGSLRPPAMSPEPRATISLSLFPSSLWGPRNASPGAPKPPGLRN